jgi:PAS domain S-box-containing protein
MNAIAQSTIQSRTILLVGGSLENRQTYAEFLNREQKNNYQIFATETLENGWKLYSQVRADAILLSCLQSDRDALTFLSWLGERAATVPVIIVVDRENEAIGISAIERGAQDYLIIEKLTDLGLCRAVANAIERAKLMQTIQQTEERLRLVGLISLRIRQSLDLGEIVNTAVEEIRQLLGCDRAIVYQAQLGHQHTIIAESVAPGWQPFKGTQFNDASLDDYQSKNYCHTQVRAITNIYEANLSETYIQQLENAQIKAMLLVPILIEQDKSSPYQNQSSVQGLFWGCLVVQQCARFRDWQPAEVQLLYELAIQIAIAIQQAILFEQLKTKNLQLQASQARFHSLVETTGDWVWEVDRNAGYTYTNSQVFSILGYLPEEIISKTLFELMPVPENERATDFWLSLVAEQQPFKSVENIYWHKDGRFVVLETSGVAIFDLEGRFQGYRGIAREITERKQAEVIRQEQLAELSEWRNRYDAAGRASGQILYEWDSQSDTPLWGANTAQILGYSDAELPTSMQGWINLIHPDDRQHFVIQSSRRKTNKPCQAEYRVRRKDETYIWIEDRNQSFANSRGELVRVVGFLRDISYRKQAEEQLQKSEQMLQLVIDAFPQRVYWKDRHFCYLGCNKRFAQDVRLDSPEDIVGRDDFELFPKALASRYRAEDASVMEKNIAKIYHEEPLVRDNGTLTWLRITKIPLVNDLGEVFGMFGAYEDITDRKHAEQQLRHTNEQLAKANTELERATRLKNEFLASMSHELRTPLNSILGLSEALKANVYGNLTDAQKRSLNTIAKSGKHLLELINDILDLAKIESGKLELQITPTSIKQLFFSSLNFVKQQAHQKKIKLNYNIPKGIETIQVDERRIRQVLINLLTNAVKFTPEGGKIDLIVDTYRQSEMLGFSVIDTGIGIPSEKFDLLFQSFVQLDSSLSRRYAGTGLGLALVRRLVELHGGMVTVESEVGVGSKFTVFLPWKAKNLCLPVEPTEEEETIFFTHRPTPEVPLIVVAEDNDDNIETLWDYLQARGYRLMRAHNGIEVIDIAQVQKPQAILMDVQMPQMDGLEATRRLKANPETGNIPIIIVTALAMEGDREKGLAAGADEYITKPMSLKKLCDKIDEMLNNEA